MPLNVVVNNLFEQKKYTEVEKVFLPSVSGDATILADHIPMVAQVNGEMELFFSEDRTEKILVNNGIASIDKDNIKVFF